MATAFHIDPSYIFILSMGLLLGSFLTMASYRLPRGEDLVFKRSSCPHCQHPLNVLDLLPLFSYLLFKGKCRYCHQAISWRYPLIESGTALLITFIYALYGANAHGITVMLLALCLLLLIITDIEHYIIPDTVQLGILLTTALLIWQKQDSFLPHGLGGALALFLTLTLKYGYIFLRKKDGLGLGDVKLLTLAGLYCGYEALPFFLFCCGVGGILTSFLWRFLGRGPLFPFGPAIAVTWIGYVLIAPYLQ